MSIVLAFLYTNMIFTVICYASHCPGWKPVLIQPNGSALGWSELLFPFSRRRSADGRPATGMMIARFLPQDVAVGLN